MAVLELKNNTPFSNDGGLNCLADEIRGDLYGKYKIKTGLLELDDLLGGGFQRGCLYMLAARPGMGATTAAIDLLRRVGYQKKFRCKYFNLDTTCEDTLLRLSDGVELNNGINHSWNELEISIDDSAKVLFDYMIGKRHAEKKLSDIDFLIIDNLELLKEQYRERTGRWGSKDELSMLKQLARAFNMAIVVLSNEDDRFVNDNEYKQSLDYIRDQESAEIFCNGIITLFREEYYKPETENKGIIEIEVLKNTCGKEGSCQFEFHPELCRLENIYSE